MDLIVGVNKGSILNSPQDDAGQVRPVNGDIEFNVDAQGIVTLVSEDGGKTVEVIPVAPGRVTYTASANADLGSGTRIIHSNPIVINVAPQPTPEATHIVSTEGPVVPQ